MHSDSCVPRVLEDNSRVFFEICRGTKKNTRAIVNLAVGGTVCLNARSILPDLFALMCSFSVDALAITETILDPSILDAMVCPWNYIRFLLGVYSSCMEVYLLLFKIIV